MKGKFVLLTSLEDTGGWTYQRVRTNLRQLRSTPNPLYSRRIHLKRENQTKNVINSAKPSQILPFTISFFLV